MLADDLGHGVMLAARQGHAAGEITGPANFLYGLVFEATGIHDMGLHFADGAALSIPDTVVRRSYLANREAIETAMVGTQLLGVRFATLIRFLPLLLLLYLVGTVDGLTERAIRRSCGGRESASLYHRAKYLQMVVLGLGLPCTRRNRWTILRCPFTLGDADAKPDQANPRAARFSRIDPSASHLS